MSDYDSPDHESPHNPGNLPADHWLHELESIKDLLEDQLQTPQPDNIPLLDEPVQQEQPTPPLLNIDSIFEDEFPEPPQIEQRVAAAAPPFQFPRFTLDIIGDDAPDNNEAPPRPTATTARSRVRPDYSRELLIQELVDEFIPQIEAALRERLDQLDITTLRAWKKPE